jgi:hypothetical protein
MRRWIGLLLALPLASCGDGVPHPPFSPQATNGLSPVEGAPPPGRVEAIPKKPPQADAWVDGEWILQHGRWYWLIGRWVKTPPGATYSPWVVVRASDGTPFYAPSVWRDATGAAMAPPRPLAFATASGEVVVGAGGDPEDTGRSLEDAPLPPDAGVDGASPSDASPASPPDASPASPASSPDASPPSPPS